MPKPTDIVEPEMVEMIGKNGKKIRMSKMHYDAFAGGYSANERARLRSITPPGFAKAFYEENK